MFRVDTGGNIAFVQHQHSVWNRAIDARPHHPMGTLLSILTIPPVIPRSKPYPTTSCVVDCIMNALDNGIRNHAHIMSARKRFSYHRSTTAFANVDPWL